MWSSYVVVVFPKNAVVKLCSSSQLQNGNENEESRDPSRALSCDSFWECSSCYCIFGYVVHLHA